MSHPFKPVKDLMSVHRLTGGRCLVVGEEIAALADDRGDQGLAHAARRLIKHAEHHEGVRIRRRVQRIAKGDGAASEIDRILDNVVRMMCNHLEGLKTALAGQVLHKQAHAVFDGCFPEGLGPVISVPYEDELIQVRRIAGLLDALPAAVIDGLGIRWHFSEIERLLPAYAEALAARRLVTSGDLTHAREQMHASLCGLVAWIVAHYFEEADHPTRDELLAPVLEQQARLSALMRARRLGRASATPAEESDSIDAIVDAEAALDEADGLAADGVDDATDESVEALSPAAGSQPAERPTPINRPINLPSDPADG